jgi:hypothetical protein
MFCKLLKKNLKFNAMTNHIAQYLGLAQNAEESLIKAFAKISKQHAFEPDVVEMCDKFTLWSKQHLESIDKLTPLFEKEEDDEPEEIVDALFPKPRVGGYGLLRDLHSLSLLVQETQMCWVVLLQAAKALRNNEMELVCTECEQHLKKETMWLLTRIKNAAPQALVVA